MLWSTVKDTKWEEIKTFRFFTLINYSVLFQGNTAKVYCEVQYKLQDVFGTKEQFETPKYGEILS